MQWGWAAKKKRFEIEIPLGKINIMSAFKNELLSTLKNRFYFKCYKSLREYKVEIELLNVLKIQYI